MDPIHYRTFEVRFRAATPHISARVHVKDLKMRTHLFFPYAPGAGKADQQAMARLLACKISVDATSEFSKGTLLLSKDLTTPLK